jgi:AraC-like DNA-binding protein
MLLHPLRDALVVDEAGLATRRHLVLESSDWDEISDSTDDVYMPFRVRRLDGGSPDSFHYTCAIGGFTLSRFRYGAAVALSDFEPDSGRGMALTTIQGTVRHQGEAWTSEGESFLVDVSRSPYALDADSHHIQLNLTFPHDLLAELYERWHGVTAAEAMWRHSFKFGGPGSSWHALMDYSTRCIAEMPDQVADGPLGRHLEQMLGMNLLTQWGRRSGDPALNRSDGLAPRYVRVAEEYLRSHAREAPTLTEVATEVGVSVRALTGAFRSYRDQSPMGLLREIRMNGVRGDLLSAPAGATVSGVLRSWGYVNHGVFAQAYRRRFGEPPSATLGRIRTR